MLGNLYYADNKFLLNPKNSSIINAKLTMMSHALALPRAIVALVLLTLMLWVANPPHNIPEIWAIFRLDQFGEFVETTSLKAHPARSLDIANSFTYSYKVNVNGEPQTFEITQEFSQKEFDELYTSRRLRVKYLPDDPALSRYISNTGGLYVGVLLFSLIAPALFWIGLAPLLRFIAVWGWARYYSGKLIIGQVNEIRAEDLAGDFKVTVDFTISRAWNPTFRGILQEVQGQTSCIRNDLRNLPLPSSDNLYVWVLYQPKTSTYEVM